jgi:hypothetical protein
MSDDPVWDAFVASLDPVAVERERTNLVPAIERPHGPEDVRMRAQHATRAAAFWASAQGDLGQVRIEQIGWRARAAERAARQQREAARRAFARTHRKAAA